MAERRRFTRREFNRLLALSLTAPIVLGPTPDQPFTPGLSSIFETVAASGNESFTQYLDIFRSFARELKVELPEGITEASMSWAVGISEMTRRIVRSKDGIVAKATNKIAGVYNEYNFEDKQIPDEFFLMPSRFFGDLTKQARLNMAIKGEKSIRALRYQNILNDHFGVGNHTLEQHADIEKTEFIIRNPVDKRVLVYRSRQYVVETDHFLLRSYENPNQPFCLSIKDIDTQYPGFDLEGEEVRAAFDILSAI